MTDTRITLPGGAVVVIRADGKVHVEGPLDAEALEIIHALDPDAEVVCVPPAPAADADASEGQGPERTPQSSS